MLAFNNPNLSMPEGIKLKLWPSVILITCQEDRACFCVTPGHKISDITEESILLCKKIGRTSYYHKAKIFLHISIK